MTREEMWKEFEKQLIRETRTPITVSYDVSEKMTKSAIERTVAKWKERLEQEPKPMVEIDLYSVIKQKYIEREVLDKIRAEIENAMKYQYAVGENEYAEGFEKSLEIIDKYKAESEEK